MDSIKAKMKVQKATPSGNMELVIDNPDAQGFLKPLKKYYITITEAAD